jgi:hypothetical protein
MMAGVNMALRCIHTEHLEVQQTEKFRREGCLKYAARRHSDEIVKQVATLMAKNPAKSAN